MSIHQHLQPKADSSQGSINTENVDSAGLQMHVGKYRLLERIGEGGMGEVYVAEQREPYYREVAVKLIKADTLNSEGIQHYLARFEAERQALAMMNHPNIAKVIDGGATALAGPYIVMELCRGKELIDYCRKNQLDLPNRLELFLEVCYAVEHAHQKGIVHRDLKPSNIIVQEMDGSPTVKVIDFGLAKALQPAIRLTDKTLHTRHGVFVGTYKYTSPEQAAAENEDIDTRSDVYSLGIILYELLTNTTPIDDRFISSHPPSEILRVIREVEPSRPSSVNRNRSRSNLEESPFLRQYASALRNELDWITLKAIRKERNHRYQTVSALADDIQNFLKHEPVSARPPSQLYRLRKFASRNRAFVSAVVAIFLATSITAIGLSLAYQQSRRNELIVGQLLATQQQLVQEQLNKNEVLKKANLETAEALRQQQLAQASTKSALEQTERSKKIAEKALAEQIVAVERQERSIIQEAETAKRAGIQAWSKNDRQTASEQFLQSLRLNPSDQSTQAWLYAILADKANLPSQSPDLVFGGDSQTKKTLLSQDGSVILCQQIDNQVRVFSVAALMKEGIEKAHRGKVFSLDSEKFVFDIYSDAQQNCIYILTGDTPSKSKKPCISVWRYNGEAVERVSVYQPTTQFYTEPFFGPTGEWYVARGGNDYTERSRQHYSIIDCQSGMLVQEFLNIDHAESFAISPDGSQIITTGTASSRPTSDLSGNPLESLTVDGLNNTQTNDGKASESFSYDRNSNDPNLLNLQPVLFDIKSKSLTYIPLLSNPVSRVGFDKLGRISVKNQEFYRQRPVQQSIQETYTVDVPMVVKKRHRYNIMVPSKTKLENGKRNRQLVLQERERIIEVIETKKETRTRIVNAIQYLTEQVWDEQIHYDRDQPPLAYVATELGTFLLDRNGEAAGRLQEMSDPILDRIEAYTPRSFMVAKPNQIQTFPGLSMIVVRYPGEFQIYRIPSAEELHDDWPIIPWASFRASPFQEMHAQPKFDATINLQCDAVAIPMSVNMIHLYRLSTTLPELPTPFYPQSGGIHFQASSVSPSEKWMATIGSNSDGKESLLLTELRPQLTSNTSSLELAEDIRKVGEIFVYSKAQRLVLSDYVPPERPGFCIDGCGTMVAPNQIVLDADGSPRKIENVLGTPEPAESVSPSVESSTDDNAPSNAPNSERSLLELDDAESPSQPDKLIEGKSDLDLYRDYPMGNFWVLSFPDGKVLSNQIPGIIAAVTDKNPIALVRNYNRLYFYDVEKLAWLRLPLQFGAEVTACTYSPNGHLFAIGTKSGEAIWFDSSSLSEVGRFQLEDEIVELEFNSANDCLAIQTSTYLPLPKGLDSNRFVLLNLANSEKIYSSQPGIQFRGFSADSSKVLVQNQMVGEEAFSVLDPRSPENPLSFVFPPLAKDGLNVSFVNSDLIAVTEGRETWLYSCRWNAPASPRFVHPDMTQRSTYIPKVISIDHGEEITLAFDADTTMRVWQVELPIRDFSRSSFDFHPNDLSVLSQTILAGQNVKPLMVDRRESTAQRPESKTGTSKWQQLVTWLSRGRTDKSLWPDPWNSKSIGILSNDTPTEPMPVATENPPSHSTVPENP